MDLSTLRISLGDTCHHKSQRIFFVKLIENNWVLRFKKTYRNNIYQYTVPIVKRGLIVIIWWRVYSALLHLTIYRSTVLLYSINIQLTSLRSSRDVGNKIGSTEYVNSPWCHCRMSRVAAACKSTIIRK